MSFRNANGLTALDLSQDETTLLALLSMVGVKEMNMHGKDKKGKNILHQLIRQNFNRASQLLISKIPRKQVKAMILSCAKTNNSNVLMTAATYGSESCLQLLLDFNSTWSWLRDENLSYENF